MDRRVIVVKKYVMDNPNIGKLQPLMWGDGSPIENCYSDFPNGGDIFVPTQFPGIPEEPVEISVEPNHQESSGYVDTTAMHYSKFVYNPHTCERSSTAGRLFDVIEVSAFPTGETGFYVDSDFFPTQFFFLQESGGEEIRGPFKRGECDFQEEGWRTTIIAPSPSEAIVRICPLLAQRLVGVFKESELPASVFRQLSKLRTFRVDYDERKFVIDFSTVAELINSDPARYYADLMTDHDVVTWLNLSIRRQFDLSKEDIQKFRQMVITFGEQGGEFELPDIFIHERIERATKYLQSMEETEEIVSRFIDENLSRFLESDAGERILEKYVRSKRGHIIEELRDEVLQDEERLIAARRERLNTEIADLEAAKKGLQEEVKRLSEQSDQAKQEATAEVLAEKSAELERLGKSIVIKQKELEELQNHVEVAKDLQTLKNEATELERKREYLQQAVEEERRTKELLKSENRATEAELRQRLLREKLYIDTLIGAAPETSEHFEQRRFWIPVRTEDLEILDILNGVRDYFLANGRDTSILQVANYLISILQNRLTIFVGYPGVGKTSTTRILAEALGMNQSDAERLLKVSVGRGWVSSRDLVGFHNPLTGSFQAAPTGLYHALKALQEERNEQRPGVPLWILLDEINLSPVEHYWSDFMTTTDSVEGSIRCGSETLVFDHALRFIGTANYDETTEPLSPRVISRANIIYVAPPESRSYMYEDEDQIVVPDRVFTMEQLRPLWDVRPEHTENEQILVNQLAILLQRHSDEQGSLGSITVVDPRVKKSMAMYCAAARDIMRPHLGDFGALDFAFSQRVLPRCRGTGQGYARRLEQVRDYCRNKQLTRSAQVIDRILEQGRLYQSYDFFGM